MVPNAERRRPRAVSAWRLLAAIAALAPLATTACEPDAVVAVGPPVLLQRVSGSGQTAPPGEALERPLVARLVDAAGRPVRRVEVRWSVTAGEVTPAVSATDAKGEATTIWRLGTEAGEQRALAEADGLASAEFVAYVDPTADPGRVPLRVLSLTTYDGSGQVVHPDVTEALGGLDGGVRLAITPYPWGNATFENPSLFASAGDDGWEVPAGVTNPIVRPPVGHLSDPDLVWMPEVRTLRLYYRHVAAENEILLVESTDGIRWSAPRLVVRAPNHEAISPSVVRRAPDDWWMWTVNGGAAGCGGASAQVEVRRSRDGVTWSPPRAVALTQPGVFPWHVEVRWIAARGEYWALFNAKAPGSCTTDALYLSTSADGMTWRTFRSPVLRRGAIPDFADVVYRATFSYDAERDLVSLWHSGARYTPRGYEWRAAYERRRRAELFDAVARADAGLTERSTAPPLDNTTAP